MNYFLCVFAFFSLNLAAVNTHEDSNNEPPKIPIYKLKYKRTLENGEQVGIFQNDQGDTKEKCLKDSEVRRERAIPN